MSETGTYRQIGQDRAAEIAIAGLGFLVADPDRLSRFLALSGIDASAIRAAAAEPGFLAGVIQHILADDRIAQAFAVDEGLSASELSAAGLALGAFWEQDAP